MKQRVLVLNGQRIVQAEAESGVWRNDKVERAGTLPPGLYNLHSAGAARAEANARHDGPVIHVDGEHVYQQVGKALVKHDAGAFNSPPDVGRVVSIQYDAAGKVNVAAVSATLARGRSR